MIWSPIRRIAQAVCVLAFLVEFTIAGAADGNWVDAWGAPPDSVGPELKAESIRQIVRASIGGAALRLRFSNLFGSAVTIGSVHVAASATGSGVLLATDRAVTFGGTLGVTIGKGASVLSDVVEFPIHALESLAVTIYLPAGASSSTIHGAGMQTVFITAGDATGALNFPEGETDDSRYFLTDVEVSATADAKAIVILGDSITDGVGSTEDHYARWSDVLAARLQASTGLESIAVVNSGIAGNRILNDGADPFVGPSASSRLERDVLAKPGVRWVLLSEGIGDIIASELLSSPSERVSARQIIEGIQRLVARAHARNLKIGVATLMPYGGAVLPSAQGSGRRLVYSSAGEAKRQFINAWIRNSRTFDAVIDFDRVTQDPGHPNQLLPAFDSGDHLHPNDAGYQAMAASIDLRCFISGSCR